jgi:prepilin-type N-terminal cleavage/methylation domain-containing protein
LNIAAHFDGDREMEMCFAENLTQSLDACQIHAVGRVPKCPALVVVCKAFLRRVSFTLIELLVVIAVVGILAALLVPALARANELAKITQCLSNLRQVGHAVHMYLADNNGTFPPHCNIFLPKPGRIVHALALAGKDQYPANSFVAPGTNRLLYPYLRVAEVCRCPADKGMQESWFAQVGCGSGIWKPGKYEALGSSYCFKSSSVGNSTLQDADGGDDIGENLSRKKENWVPDPVRFIMIYEPPVTWWGNYYHWHYARGPTTVPPAQLDGDRQKFISPILFVNGQTRNHDFTHALKDDPNYPMEPTKDWVWYRPMP